MDIIVQDIARGYYDQASPAAYAAISRALTRLWQRGLIEKYNPQLCRQGGGALGYTLTALGRGLAVAAAPT